MRLIGIDYGTKKVGIAISDAENIIATPLCTVVPAILLETIDDILGKYPIKTIAVGVPVSENKDKTFSNIVNSLVEDLKKRYNQQNIIIETVNERYTSLLAKASLNQSGFSKKVRGEKHNIDKMSAAIILQSYMDMHERADRV